MTFLNDKNEVTEYITSIDKVQQYHQWLKDRLRIAEDMKLEDVANRRIALQRFEEIFVLNTEKKYGVWNG